MEASKSKVALVEFLDYLAQKGLLAPATAQARKIAVNAILGVLDDSENEDVTLIDLDSAIMRFHNLQGKAFTPDSLKTYKSRVKSAIADFSSYLQSPLSFKSATQSRDKKPTVKKGPSDDSPRASEQTEESPRTVAAVAPVGVSIFPIPLRKDLTVQIYGLPFDLTEAEAKRIAAVVQALAVLES